jgi:hypothetical protein
LNLVTHLRELSTFKAIQQDLPDSFVKVHLQSSAEFLENVCFSATEAAVILLFVEVLIDDKIGRGL